MNSANPNPSHRSGPAAMVAAVLFFLALAVIWLKTGRVPAASGGDEVWYGEGAYWLLKNGLIQFHFLADEHEHQVRTMFPPVASLFNALVFTIGGISPFTLMLQIPVLSTVVMVCLFFIGRRLAFPLWLAWLVPVAIWGLMMVERRLSIVRWEPWTAMWVVVAFHALLVAAQSEGWKRWLGQGLAGVFAVLAGVSYYPHAPFALLAVGGAAIFLAGIMPLTQLPARLWAFAVGGLCSGGIFLAWIFRNYDLFHKQVIAFGDEHYFQLESLLWPIITFFRPFNFQDWLALAEHGVFIVLALLALFILRDPRGKAAAWVALVMSGPVFLYRKPIMDIAGGIFGVVVVALLACHWRGKWPGKIAVVGLWALAVAAMAKFAMGAHTFYAQADRRSYSLFEEKLSGALGANHGKIASSQFTWLALREKKGPDEFNFIAKYGDPSYDYRSTALRTREGIETHSHIIVAKGYESMIRNYYPEMQAAIDDGTFVKTTEIIMPGPTLPWSGAPIYDCTIYRNTRISP